MREAEKDGRLVPLEKVEEFGLFRNVPRSMRTEIERYLRERLAAFPELTGRRLYREIRDLGYAGGYTAVKDFLREMRPRSVSWASESLRKTCR